MNLIDKYFEIYEQIPVENEFSSDPVEKTYSLPIPYVGTNVPISEYDNFPHKKLNPELYENFDDDNFRVLNEFDNHFQQYDFATDIKPGDFEPQKLTRDDREAFSSSGIDIEDDDEINRFFSTSNPKPIKKNVYNLLRANFK